MNPDDLEPVGDCIVCGEMVDHYEMGVCNSCDGIFHWSRCGGWGNTEHECNLCMMGDASG